MPGKIGALHDRFANHTVGLFKEYGFGIGGFWTEEFGTTSRLTYLLSFADMADRDKKFSAFGSDPRWQEARARSEADGPLVDKIHNKIMPQWPKIFLKFKAILNKSSSLHNIHSESLTTNKQK